MVPTSPPRRLVPPSRPGRGPWFNGRTVNVEPTRTLARGLLRRGWRATVILAVLTGLAAGVAMAVVGAGRRTATAYDRFAAFADPPELMLNFCPPGTNLGAEGSLVPCYSYDAAEERNAIVALDEVAAAARAQFRGFTIAPAAEPDQAVVGGTIAVLDPGIPATPSGRYLVVNGRDATAADEVLLNEALAERSGIGVGDRVVLSFWSPEELGSLGTDSTTFTGPSVDAEVVGIARALTDLAAATEAVSGGNAFAVLGPGMAEATADAAGFTGVLVEATGDDAGAARAAIERGLENQLFQAVPALGIDEIAPTRDAIRYEAQATLVLGVLLAALVATFVGQAIARQSRREWSDGPILRAVGVSTREAATSAWLRGAAIGVPAAVVGVATAILLSPRGPVGVGRRAEVDPGIRLDLPVLVLGGLLVVGICAAGAASPLLRGRALRRAVVKMPRTRPRRSFGLPPVPSAGLHLARTSRGARVDVATALASASVAVIAIVAAAVLTASFDDLAATPARFGAPWDLSIGGGVEGPAEVEALLAESADRVERAAVITGTDLLIGDETAWVHAYLPLEEVSDQVVPLPIARGRPPATAREIALGELTMAASGASIGDTVTLSGFGSSAGEEFEMTVVGSTIINDNFESSPGRGAAVTPEFIAEAAPEVVGLGNSVIVTFVPGTDVDDVAEELRSRYPGSVEEPIQQAAVLNVGRIRNLPYVMAAVVALLATASLVHALVLSVGRNRRVLGVLKGLGFTRVQVSATVAWHATSYAIVALIVALPLGVVAGRWGWRLVAEALGVPAVAIIPLFALAAVIVGLLALFNLAAAYPAWRAARLSTAAALRAE